MIWRTIGVGFGMVLVGLCVMAAEVQALSCGDIITTDTKLRRNLTNCPDNGLVIGASGIKLNLNGKRITGSGEGVGVLVSGFEDVTIRNGKIRNFGTAMIVNLGSHRARIRKMDLRGPDGLGMQVNASEDVEVKYTRLSNFKASGLLVITSDNFVLRNSRITNVGKGEGDNCGGGVGIETFLSEGVEIKFNRFERISRSAIVHTSSPEGRISGNKITRTGSRPCSGDDFGAITINAGSSRTEVAYNKVFRNSDFAVGLRQNTQDITVNHNKFWRNAGGFFFSLNSAGTRITGNCISGSTSGIGLLIDPNEPQTFIYAVDARDNYWGSRSGPSGKGSSDTELSGSGEEIIQKEIDAVEVIPFKRRCH